jgi:tetratricopeptide (TPR) repeat protein
MTLIRVAFLLVLGSFVAALGKTTNPGWLLINLALVTLMAWLTILPHEAGHAFIAKLVGLHVDRIVLGSGRKLGTFMLCKVPIEIHLYPAGGLTLVEVRDVPHFRWKFAAVTLAGPVVDILLLWAAITWGETAWRAERIEGGFAPVCALIAALFLGIVFNLWPMSVGTSAGKTANDGARLLSLALRKPLDFKSAGRSQDLARLNDLFAKRQWREVVQHADHYLLELPDDYAIQVTLSAALINLGDFDRSRALLEQLIDRAASNDWQRAVVANNLAWLYLLLDDDSLSERSLLLSATAYAWLPWEPFITSTHAAAQALFGDAEQAIRLFNTNRVRQGHVSTRASMFAGLAIAHARLGRTEDAMAALRLAHEIDPEAQLVGIAQRRVRSGR